MPTISLFYGIAIAMYYFDNGRHNPPHIHARCQGRSAVFSIADGAVLDGEIPLGKARLVQAWIEIRREDLMADWELACNGQALFIIEPLR
jgi:hypothetical protein